MFKSLFNFFFPQSVSGVMASFQKTVDDLNKVAEHQEAKAEKKDAKIEQLYDEVYDLEEACHAHRVEANSARALATRVAKHFGLDN